VRAVMGIRGEPSTPSEPGKGLVWTRILEQVDWPGSSSDFVSVVDLDRQRLTNHPWSIGGGGAAVLKEQLENDAIIRLRVLAEANGVTAISGEDDVALYPPSVPRRHRISSDFIRHLVHGLINRDWVSAPDSVVYFPYDDSQLLRVD